MREFLDFASSNIHAITIGEKYKVPCPCKQCNNNCHMTKNEINKDLFMNGIVVGYTCWIYHDECEPPQKQAMMTMILVAFLE